MYTGIFITFFLLQLSQGVYGSEENITLNVAGVGTNKIVKIPKNDTFIINAVNIPSSISVLIFQVHSQAENVTLSEQLKVGIHNSVTGRNIGMAVKLKVLTSKKQMWLINLNEKELSVLIVISSLDSYGPVPGGCNMEFPTEIAPYIKLRSDTMQIYLEYQHASFGFHRDEPHPKCSLSSPYINYEIFVFFLDENDFGEEEFFRNLECMSNVSSIKKYAIKAKSYSLHPNTRYSFLMYPNVGVIYNVIAKYTINTEIKETAYIPAVSYGCAPFEFTRDGCRIRYSVGGRIFLFLLSVYGFMLAFFGYTFVGPIIFFFGLLISCLFTFILLGRYLSLSKETTAELSIVAGLLGGAFFLFLWLWLHNPLILMLFNGFVFGFLFTATIFYTPIGNFEIFINNTNFWSSIFVGVLTITILSIAVPAWMITIGISVVGSYIMLLFYDDFVGTRLSYIILNIIKRSVSKKLTFASNELPFQTNDIIMATLWTTLSCFAVIVWCKNPFSNVNKLIQANSSCFGYPAMRNRQKLMVDNIRQPLLNGHNTSVYETF